jgi:carbonic anhydrase/acetyltransferase-like protein (isoleucine patch superfamily)
MAKLTTTERATVAKIKQELLAARGVYSAKLPGRIQSVTLGGSEFLVYGDENAPQSWWVNLLDSAKLPGRIQSAKETFRVYFGGGDVVRVPYVPQVSTGDPRTVEWSQDMRSPGHSRGVLAELNLRPELGVQAEVDPEHPRRLNLRVTAASEVALDRAVKEVSGLISCGRLPQGEAVPPEVLALQPDAEWHKHPNGGGWVSSTATVDATAYVGPNAVVYGEARVYGDARVSGGAQVFGEARVYGNAHVFGKALVCGDAQVSGKALVCGDARVSGNAWVSGEARVYGKARVYGEARVYGDAELVLTREGRATGDTIDSLRRTGWSQAELVRQGLAEVRPRRG